MQITEALLPARSVSEVAGFFEQFGCVVDRDASGATVAIGRSRLRFVERAFDGAHHLAFTIPTGTFDLARQWLEHRAPLLALDDQTEFEGPESWDSRSMYFDGPDGQVLELIERRALPSGHSDSFTADDLVCVSEIGVAVPDVLAAVRELRAVGVRPYGSAPGSGFAAVGDVDGLLILVSPGRSWFPTTSRHVADTPVDVRASVRHATTLGAGKRLRPAAAKLDVRSTID